MQTKVKRKEEINKNEQTNKHRCPEGITLHVKPFPLNHEEQSPEP